MQTSRQLSLSLEGTSEKLAVVGERDASELDIEPLDATFTDPSRAPLHSWFPYLEGYSPRFVERVLAEYLPRAARVLEPFAGSGTTAIVLGQIGVHAAYSEANPSMAFIVATKLKVLRLSSRRRAKLAADIREIAKKLERFVDGAGPDPKLHDAYSNTFGSSVFFDPAVYERVLRMRTLNDKLEAQRPLLGHCVGLAVLASLIPTSRLERAGDLRYKTEKELARQTLPFVEYVRQRLLAQAQDIETVPGLKVDATFACDAAADMHAYLDQDWDGVITSPPYLNGTNYIRNARLELWYQRFASNQSDLRLLRDKVITSGINDVNAETNWSPVTKGVELIVSTLREHAYDTRISKMVGGYFKSMSSVFASLYKCLRPRARLCIDIGDSAYGGIHVPTDDLLLEVAEENGFVPHQRVHLRKRYSKGGSVLRQQLLVLEKGSRTMTGSPVTPRPDITRLRTLAAPIEMKWKRFKQELPHQLKPYSAREWGGPGHSMCSYQGKMKPSLAHHLLECFSKKGDVVVDPFAGAGTIPFEACRMGRMGFGIDISRLGHVLTTAKVAEVSSDKLMQVFAELERALAKYQLREVDLQNAEAIRFNSAIPDYFHPDTLREILAARSFFLDRWDSGSEWAVLLACTLHLLHGNRPYALSRRSHPITPYKPTGIAEYRALIPRLKEKLARLQEDLFAPTRRYGMSVQADCTKLWPHTIPKADAVITSPPFFDSTRFYMTNWMRFWFVGWERKDFDTQPQEFVETRQKESLDVYRDFFSAARERLRDDGVLVLHLGQSAKCNMGSELSRRVDPWFSTLDIFTEGVAHCESHGIRDKGAVHGHTYLVLAARQC
jgi:DNA modification methylase